MFYDIQRKRIIIIFKKFRTLLTVTLHAGRCKKTPCTWHQSTVDPQGRHVWLLQIENEFIFDEFDIRLRLKIWFEDLLYSTVFPIHAFSKAFDLSGVYPKIDSLHIDRKLNSHDVISISIISLIEFKLNWIELLMPSTGCFFTSTRVYFLNI